MSVTDSKGDKVVGPMGNDKEKVLTTQKAPRVDLNDVLRDLSEEDAENLDLYLQPIQGTDAC